VGFSEQRQRGARDGERDADRWNKSMVCFGMAPFWSTISQRLSPTCNTLIYGLGAISAQILKEENTTGPFDLADVYHRLSLSGQLAGYELHERFYEIGSHKGLAEATDYFKGRGE
jgi:MurNAc alpha-1-phosphate uridylyltransferase